MGYALVKDGKIAGIYNSLPTGFQGITGFNNFTAEQAKNHGFIPYEYIQGEYNPYLQKLGETDFTITPDLVTGVRQILDHTVEMKEQLRLDAVRNLDATLVNVLRNTDWTLLPDSELDAEELAAYAEIRSESRALRLTIGDMDINQLAVLADEYQSQSILSLHQEAFNRSPAIIVALENVVQEKAEKVVAEESRVAAEAIEAQTKADAEAEVNARASMAAAAGV